MTTSPDYTTPVMAVRLLISDLDEGATQIFDDYEIEGFLALEGQSIKLAAASALDAMASNEAMVAKVIKSQDLSTDGPKVATALRDHAARLRAQAADADEDGDGFYFDVLDMGDLGELGPEHTAGY